MVPCSDPRVVSQPTKQLSYCEHNFFLASPADSRYHVIKMKIAAATRKIQKARTEVGYAPRGHRGEARRAAARALRRSAAAEIAEAMSE